MFLISFQNVKSKTMSIRPLTDAIQKIAEEELNEIPTRRNEDISSIKEWITKQHHLRCRTEDQWILTFLRGCKFSLQKTKQKLEAFYSYKTLTPEFFQNRDPYLPEIQEFLKQGLLVCLTTTKDIERPGSYLLARVKPANPDKISLVSIIKCALMIVDISLNEDDNKCGGDYLIIDLKDINYNYLTQLTPSILKKVIIAISECYPLRFKGLYCINASSYFTKFYNSIKSFFPTKVVKKMFIYAENEFHLTSILPKSMLPKEYGGTGASFKEMAADIKVKVEKYQDWFAEDERFGLDEIHESIKVNLTELYGIDGSFRKLNLD